MITFTQREILFSVICAFFYGSIFASIKAVIDSSILYSKKFFDSLKRTFEYDKTFHSFKILRSTDNRSSGPILTFAYILIFFMGYLLLSYLVCDGIIRIYVLLICFASFYLLKNALFRVFEVLFLFVFNFLLGILCVFLRLVAFPFKKVFDKKNY